MYFSKSECIFVHNTILLQLILALDNIYPWQHIVPFVPIPLWRNSSYTNQHFDTQKRHISYDWSQYIPTTQDIFSFHWTKNLSSKMFIAEKWEGTYLQGFSQIPSPFLHLYWICISIFDRRGVEWWWAFRGQATTQHSATTNISWANLNAHEMENGFEVKRKRRRRSCCRDETNSNVDIPSAKVTQFQLWPN